MGLTELPSDAPRPLGLRLREPTPRRGGRFSRA